MPETLTETWYVMEDGSVADPREVAPDKSGRLRHEDGRAVAYAPHGPRSRSIDPDKERARAAKKDATGRKVAKPEDEPKGGYKTRESKAD